MKRLAALGLACYVVFLILSFPAAIAHRWFSPESLKLIGIRGTVWSGSAQRAQFGTMPLGETRWSARPWTLVLGRVAYRIRSSISSGSVDGVFGVGFTGKLHISRLTGNARLSEIASLLPDPTPAQFADAMLEFDLSDVLVVDGRPARARGTVNINELLIRQPVNQALGNYEIELSEAEDSDEVLGAFRDLSGPLEIEGTVLLHADGSYDMQCSASARSGAPPGLETAILLFCPSG